MLRLFHTGIANDHDNVLDTNEPLQIIAPHSSNPFVDPLNIYVFVPLGPRPPVCGNRATGPFSSPREY